MDNNIVISKYAKGLLTKLKKDNIPDENIYVVYGHYNTKTEMWYCGQSKYFKNINMRWRDGKEYTKKKKNRYDNPKFAPAIIKYGWECFEHYIFGYYTADKVDDAERYWIGRKGSFTNGYNCNTGGQTNKIFSDETRRKMSEANKRRNLSGANNPMYGKPGTKLGVKMSEETKRKISEGIKNSPNFKACIRKGKDNVTSKKVIAISINEGILLKRFDCVDDAGRVFGAMNGSTISACCKGKRQSAYGYFWKYDNNEQFENLSIDKFLEYRVLGKPSQIGKSKGIYREKEKQNTC